MLKRTSNYSEDMLEQFATFMKDNFLCDTILMVGTEQLKAHSVVLSAASPFFKAIFKEYEKPEMHYIRLPNLEPNIMQVILDYIYSGQLVLSSSNADIHEVSEPLVDALGLFGIDVEKIVINEEDQPPQLKQEDLSKDIGDDEEAGDEAATIYICSQCQQSFIDRQELEEHFETHNDDQNELIDHCILCNQVTSSKLEMQQHLLHMHNLTRRPSHAPTEGHLCVQCGQTFAKEAALEAHITRDHELLDPLPIRRPKTVECSACNKMFSSMSSMKLHLMMTHTHRKPFECAECGRGFVFKSQLIAHTRLHTGERPFPCNICGKSFAALLNLVQHTRTHTGERPFECGDCGNRFSQRSHLQTHLRVHTGERPFRCQLCAKSYKNRLDLRIHSLRIHQVSITLRNNNLANKNK